MFPPHFSMPSKSLRLVPPYKEDKENRGPSIEPDHELVAYVEENIEDEGNESKIFLFAFCTLVFRIGSKVINI